MEGTAAPNTTRNQNRDEESNNLMDPIPEHAVEDRYYLISSWILYIILYAGLGVCVLLGDFLLSLRWVQEQRLLLALGDNGLHTAIGGLTWALTILPYSNWSITWKCLILETVCASIAASVIDLDHFAAAGSIHINDATSLIHRPPLHGSTIWLLLWATLLLLHWHCPSGNCITMWSCWCPHHLSWMVFAAFSSHHIRDALRRGIWMPPFGSTPPVPFCLYAVLLMGMPLVLPTLMRITDTPPCLPPPPSKL